MISNQQLSSTNTSGGSPLGMSASQLVGPVVGIVLALGAAFILQSILADENSNPVAMLLLLSGVAFAVFAQIRPAPAVILFLWLAVTIDEGKRAAFAMSNMSMFDVSKILAVPVLLMGAIYFRTIFLAWFRSADAGIAAIRYKKFAPIAALTALTLVAMVRAGGLSFSALSANYAYVCYIPAAAVVPHVLSQPKHWQQMSRHFLWIFYLVGGYGLFQAIVGPLPFEKTYLESGLTSTLYLMEDGRFRAFSTMNASSTFAGAMVVACLFALFYLGSIEGRYRILTGKGFRLFVLCLIVCALATQRGAFLCGFITYCTIPLFRRPRFLQVGFLAFLALFALMVVNIDEVWAFVQRIDQDIDPLRVNGFLSQNTSLLTFGARVDSFQSLHDIQNWSAFGKGIGGDTGAGHDLTTNLMLSLGWVGLCVFLGLTLAVLGIAGNLLRSLSRFPPAYAWAQVNLAVFVFITIWSLLFGSVLYDNPLNFFFWVSVGNLLYLYKNETFLGRGLEQATPAEFGLKVKVKRNALASFAALQRKDDPNYAG